MRFAFSYTSQGTRKAQSLATALMSPIPFVSHLAKAQPGALCFFLHEPRNHESSKLGNSLDEPISFLSKRTRVCFVFSHSAPGCALRFLAHPGALCVFPAFLRKPRNQESSKLGNSADEPGILCFSPAHSAPGCALCFPIAHPGALRVFLREPKNQESSKLGNSADEPENLCFSPSHNAPGCALSFPIAHPVSLCVFLHKPRNQECSKLGNSAGEPDILCFSPSHSAPGCALCFLTQTKEPGKLKDWQQR